MGDKVSGAKTRDSRNSMEAPAKDKTGITIPVTSNFRNVRQAPPGFAAFQEAYIMKLFRNLTLAALVSFAGAANAAPNMMTNPGNGYMGFQNTNAGNIGMSNISVDMFPFAEDAMAGVQLNGYVVANVPAFGGMFIFMADKGWVPWDRQSLTPAVTMTNCSVATPCTQAQVEILQNMNMNDPAVQAMLNGATIYLGYARAGQAVSMDRVRQFTASDMINPGTPISMDPALCASSMQKPRFCM